MAVLRNDYDRKPVWLRVRGGQWGRSGRRSQGASLTSLGLLFFLENEEFQLDNL